ncbi:hypothetical protein [Labilibaculum sp.]|uniref:hypothetical protein n=1 Tax=Labilibaculum sp. TaxID=2060723 RepID=UPI002AA64931|nr:hypothetical protein [Labilibaculum sp.]
MKTKDGLLQNPLAKDKDKDKRMNLQMIRIYHLSPALAGAIKIHHLESPKHHYKILRLKPKAKNEFTNDPDASIVPCFSRDNQTAQHPLNENNWGNLKSSEAEGKE